MLGAGEVGGADQSPQDAVEGTQRRIAGPLTRAIGHVHQSVARLNPLLDQRAAMLGHGPSPALDAPVGRLHRDGRLVR